MAKTPINKHHPEVIMSYRVGIDLGGTNIVAGVVNDDYEINTKVHDQTVITNEPDMMWF